MRWSTTGTGAVGGTVAAIVAAVLVAGAFAAVLAAGCTRAVDDTAPRSGDANTSAREAMVEHQIRGRGVQDPLVLAVMREVPRHLFVPEELVDLAYADRPLPIGEGQTISQPYIVALMTELAGLEGGETVLEVGTGSGYQAAVLGEIAGSVYSVEIIESLAVSAAERLARLGYGNVEVRVGDGYRGWPEHAPFEAILVTAAPEHVPQPLIEQLAVGGRLVIPVGSQYQELLLITKTDDGVWEKSVIPVRFVPMTGEAQER
jgi:protein-L-isoaspartate(D-aspartate) O-methyltransferase